MAGEFSSSSTHPPLPPTTEDIRYAYLRLLRSRRVGPSTFHRLLTEHGTVQNALAALPEVARAAGVKNYEICPEHIVETELKAGARAGAQLLLYGHEGYPAPLTELSNAPPVLWAVGDVTLLARPAVSMVGARNASTLGMRMARALSKDIAARGFVVISGLARGIDASVHTAALPTGTIAVVAGGVDVIYPAENADLAEKIGQTGVRLSEQPMGLQPMARHFPARNRIIAGLGTVCIVVEAAAKSGSLITAREALDVGRDVLAVPGHPFDARAAGCNMLIRDGATLVRNATDVLEAINPIATAGFEKAQQGDLLDTKLSDTTHKTQRALLPDTTDLHTMILSRLGPTPVPEDQLLRELKTPPGDLSPALTDLELNGKILRHSGGLLSKAS